MSLLTERPATGWPAFDGPLARRPHTREEVIALAGDPTRGGLYLKVPDPNWVRDSVVELHGDKVGDRTPAIPGLEQFYFKIHRQLEPYAREAFRRANIVAPGYVKRSGGHVHRRISQRADLKKAVWSYHAYAWALDINSPDNKGKLFAKGRTPVPWSTVWNHVWPNGVSRLLVEAFESCGWSWGGWWKGFVDPMHFEWVGKRETKV